MLGREVVIQKLEEELPCTTLRGWRWGAPLGVGMIVEVGVPLGTGMTVAGRLFRAETWSPEPMGHGDEGWG